MMIMMYTEKFKQKMGRCSWILARFMKKPDRPCRCEQGRNKALSK
jgi:hypothetical protein